MGATRDFENRASGLGLGYAVFIDGSAGEFSRVPDFQREALWERPYSKYQRVSLSFVHAAKPVANQGS